MSSFEAIGGVSSSLQMLIRDRMELPDGVTVGELSVSVGRPVSITPGETAEDARVNLYLYRVTENPELKNQELHGHGDPGRYGNPPLSLDLHYLLTAYGSTVEEPYRNETRAHYLLGSAMKVLHDYPVVDGSLITRTLPSVQILHPSLVDEFERVKVTLEPLTLDDVSKVWTALNHDYRLSAAYVVTVVW